MYCQNANMYIYHYPLNCVFFSNMDCLVSITSPIGTNIKLVASEFSLEPHASCSYDHVSIYDGRFVCSLCNYCVLEGCLDC